MRPSSSRYPFGYPVLLFYELGHPLKPGDIRPMGCRKAVIRNSGEARIVN